MVSPRYARLPRPRRTLELALLSGLVLAGFASARTPRSRDVGRVLTQAAREAGGPEATRVVRSLLDRGLAERLAGASGGVASDLLAAELFPHNVGAYVPFEDAASGRSFRRTVFRRDFHHNGIRLLIHRSREGGDYDMETYQIGGAIGVRMDGLRVAGAALALEPAVQLLSTYPRLGETFSTTPEAVHPATGSRMTWTCRTVAVELLDLADGASVLSVAVQVTVLDAVSGDRLARFRVWYGDNMAIAKREGDFFGAALDEVATSGLVLPK